MGKIGTSPGKMLDNWKIVLIPRLPRPRPSIWGWSRVPRCMASHWGHPIPTWFFGWNQIDDYKFNAFGKSVPAIFGDSVPRP
jgi:hypothetical protein